MIVIETEIRARQITLKQKILLHINVLDPCSSYWGALDHQNRAYWIFGWNHAIRRAWKSMQQCPCEGVHSRLLPVHKPPLNSPIASRASSNFRNALPDIHRNPPHHLRFIPVIDNKNVGSLTLTHFYATEFRENVKKKGKTRGNARPTHEIYIPLSANFPKRREGCRNSLPPSCATNNKAMRAFNEKPRGWHKRYKAALGSALQLLSMLQMNAELMELRPEFFDDPCIWETLHVQFFSKLVLTD